MGETDLYRARHQAEALRGTLTALDESGATDFPSRIEIDRLRRRNVPAAIWA